MLTKTFDVDSAALQKDRGVVLRLLGGWAPLRAAARRKQSPALFGDVIRLLQEESGQAANDACDYQEGSASRGSSGQGARIEKTCPHCILLVKGCSNESDTDTNTDSVRAYTLKWINQ
mmetsp:Transcript_142080/g.250535  ORF Transcript_142080/g.250535 Transcript_142080/m.250535 type:complete len:118 (-) Transcript_142080:14-367(-)